MSHESPYQDAPEVTAEFLDMELRETIEAVVMKAEKEGVIPDTFVLCHALQLSSGDEGIAILHINIGAADTDEERLEFFRLAGRALVEHCGTIPITAFFISEAYLKEDGEKSPYLICAGISHNWYENMANVRFYRDDDSGSIRFGEREYELAADDTKHFRSNPMIALMKSAAEAYQERRGTYDLNEHKRAIPTTDVHSDPIKKIEIDYN